ncbi:DNA mismatch repair endonuclease MutL [Deinococcus radiophilus]|uniref:DNA mismatch repair protein MutL n=1 Tax=Deinococcus radiophilus TaxID=32062 RepID=A0A3S0KKV8_9DEIO|nr:DNA mismatch repair endonuclease MutL [Deinococcus radiophilus]RTR28969.1 DNA mismatch repair endonuclease MutL [Deinococcus radiophilus]UFA49553.1 DNA mismatch repair endonuclease MutL [Deinococcus radiophilus]
MTDPHIRLLPPEVARQIAAGEVVSRPLDVLRELLENALDAGSTRLEIEVERGGLGLVTVRDNGRGIPAAEVGLAPLRHATSKLGEGGLDHVSTLGFRGEALWAAAQAGELTLLTRPAGQLGAAHLRAQGDAVTVTRASAPAGTSAAVRGLFAGQPARRATQAPPASEVREMTALLGRYVLHHPQLYWRLTVDGEVRLSHAPGDHRGAVATIYGPVSANRVLPLAAAGISGVISRPELTRARRDRLHFAVNGRPVQAPAELEQAVLDAYAELLPAGTAPLAVLNLSVPPAAHNPNVHPSKQVVALADLPGLAAQVREAVAAALAGVPHVRALPDLRLPAESAQEMPAAPSGIFPEMRLLGVYQELYLLAESESDLWVIDAHAAHERALYEELQRGVAELPPFELPTPELLHLTPEQAARLAERAEALAAWGLVIEPFGAGLARLRSLPAALAALPVPDLHASVIDTALGEGGDPQRELLSRLACLPALKAGAVTEENGPQILTGLAACAQPWACPHGRPTTLRLSERDLAHTFGRRGVRDVARGRDLDG